MQKAQEILKYANFLPCFEVSGQSMYAASLDIHVVVLCKLILVLKKATGDFYLTGQRSPILLYTTSLNKITLTHLRYINHPNMCLCQYKEVHQGKACTSGLGRKEKKIFQINQTKVSLKRQWPLEYRWVNYS